MTKTTEIKTLFMAALATAAFGLSACNTVDGVGEDVEEAGEQIQDSAN